MYLLCFFFFFGGGGGVVGVEYELYSLCICALSFTFFAAQKEKAKQLKNIIIIIWGKISPQKSAPPLQKMFQAKLPLHKLWVMMEGTPLKVLGKSVGG